jgi:hypothetical protein
MDLSESNHASTRSEARLRSHRENELSLPYSSECVRVLVTVEGGPVAGDTKAFLPVGVRDCRPETVE